MKTKYILLAALLLFGFSFTQAQNDDSDFMEGLQSTLNSSFSGNPEITDLGRLWLILGSDIRMVMKAEERSESIGIGKRGTGLYGNKYDYGKGSVYGEFDWDNKALSLHFKQAKGEKLDYLLGLGMVLESDKIKKAIDAYQYMDLDGYWYIPSSPQANLGASHGYIKFHGQTAMMSLTRSMRALARSDAVNQILSEIDSGQFTLNSDYLSQLANAITSGNPEGDIMVGADGLQDLGTHLLGLLDGRLSTAFDQPLPLFMHWTLIYSPETVQQEGNFTATRFTYRGIPNCLQLTGARGKYMIFDNYNRLVFINSGPKGGSVEYFYDRDVTVNLPAASLVSVGSPFNRN